MLRSLMFLDVPVIRELSQGNRISLSPPPPLFLLVPSPFPEGGGGMMFLSSSLYERDRSAANLILKCSSSFHAF